MDMLFVRVSYTEKRSLMNIISSINRLYQVNRCKELDKLHIISIDVAVVYQVVCWLIRRKARVRAPGQTSKQNTKSISSAISFQQISDSKTKIAMKSFSKNLSFRIDFKLYFPLLVYKINTYNISGVRNQVNNPN